MAQDSVVNTVNDEEYKVNASAQPAGSALAQHLAALDAVSHQRIINGYRELAYGEATSQRAGIDVSEALGRRAEQGAALPAALAELAASLRFIRGQAEGT